MKVKFNITLILIAYGRETYVQRSENTVNAFSISIEALYVSYLYKVEDNIEEKNRV